MSAGCGPEAERAVARGAADEAATLPAAVGEADAVFVAVPVSEPRPDGRRPCWPRLRRAAS